MRRTSLCTAAALTVAGCNAQQQTAAARANAASEVTLQPGEYEYDAHTIEMKIPGKSADYDATMVAQERNDQSTVRHCVDRQEALDPRLIFSFQNKSCRFPKFAMTGGKIDARMVCQSDNASDVHVITGTYTATSFSVDLVNSQPSGPQAGYEDKSHLDGKRIGPCTESSMP